MRTSQPGPPGHANAARWRRWLFPAAISVGFVTLGCSLSSSAACAGTPASLPDGPRQSPAMTTAGEPPSSTIRISR
jgi:hypothetical protein